jgi:DNA-binding transcriptional LysR family regulator
MRFLHHHRAMLSQLRSFLTVIEEGSLHRAAARLNISQSALSRQMQALEDELGGRLLERSTTGVRPTAGGHALAETMGRFLAQYDTAMLEVRRAVRGEKEQLRIGYLASAFQQYLEPALKRVRETYPKVRVKLFDMFPGEQVTALRQGEIDVAMIDQGSDFIGREFYTRKLTVVRSVVALPASHPLAKRPQVRLAELKDETFLCNTEESVPGQRQRLIELCKKRGKFKPRLMTNPGDVSAGLGMVANEDVVCILPAFMQHLTAPDVVLAPLADPEATWELFVVWQRGRVSGPVAELLKMLKGQT